MICYMYMYMYLPGSSLVVVLKAEDAEGEAAGDSLGAQTLFNKGYRKKINVSVQTYKSYQRGSVTDY